MNVLAAAGALLADVVVPPRCAGCDGPGSWLCARCTGTFEPVRGGPPGVPTWAAGSYEGGLRAAIRRFKYHGESALSRELGALVSGGLAADLATGVVVDAVLAVPLHPARVRERGYDQTFLLAREVAELCGLPRLAGLHRIRHSRPQVVLDRAARRRNVDGAFVAIAGSLRGLRVALVDDVATTGATLVEAARAARSAGARSVRAYVIAADE